jgi:hypothetical protein
MATSLAFPVLIGITVLGPLSAAAWLMFHLRGQDGSGGSDADSGGGQGGVGPRPPHNSPPPSGLVSWPEFEREFAEYAARWQNAKASDPPQR